MLEIKRMQININIIYRIADVSAGNNNVHTHAYIRHFYDFTNYTAC